MAKILLTDDVIATLSVPNNRTHTEFFDTQSPGLFVDVQRSGRMTFRVRRQANGRASVKTLGDPATLPLAEARAAAHQWREKPVSQPEATHQVVGTGGALEGAEKGLSVRDFFTLHYLPYVKSYKRSWGTDECMLRVNIIPRLGDHEMTSIKPPVVAQFVLDMREQGLAPGTCNRALVLLRYGFALAIRWGLYGRSVNPMQEVRNLRDDNKRERFLTDSELQRLLTSVSESDNKSLMSIVLFLIYTGARKREVLNARWEDVDWGNKSWRIPVTKSGKVRHVPLSNGAQALLRSHQAAQNDQLGGNTTPFIFVNPATLAPFVTVYYSWDTARKQAGLPELRMHDLRHSFASFLVNAGRSLYEVQELLGHADIRTTSRYAHLSRERLNAAVEIITPKIVTRQGVLC